MIRKLKGCFSDFPVNKGRQYELDIVKGICLILMVFAHAYETIEWFFDPETSSGVYDMAFNRIIGNSFGAPLFMICMGISFHYSRRATSHDMLMRVVRMLGIVYLLELLRTAIPGLIEWLIYRSPECIYYVYAFFGVDILQFSTLAILAVAIFKKLRIRPAVMLLISVVTCIAGQLLAGVSLGSSVADVAAGFMWRSVDTSYFPFLNWLIFPVFGYIIGYLWVRLNDKDTLFKILTPLCSVIGLAYYVLMAVSGKWCYFSSGDYYAIGLIDAIFNIIAGIAVLGIAHFLYNLLGERISWLIYLGSRITSVYCIHWVIYGFLYPAVLIILGDGYLPQWSVLIIAPSVLIVSDILSKLYVLFRKKHTKNIQINNDLKGDATL